MYIFVIRCQLVSTEKALAFTITEKALAFTITSAMASTSTWTMAFRNCQLR